MAYTEVLTSGNSAVTSAEQWDDMCHQEYVGKMMMKWLIGTGPDSVIIAQEDLTKKAGDAMTYHFATSQSGGTVRGNAKGVGNEGSMNFYAQRFVIDNVRNLHKIWDVPMTQKRVSFNILEQAKHALSTKHAEVFDDDMVAGLCDAGTGRVRGRYLYGAADSNWNATHASALTAIDNAADQLTTNMISVAKRKCTIKGTGVTEKVKPSRVVNSKNYEEWFVGLFHTYAIRDLVKNDAAFRNAQLLLTPRGTNDSIFFTGSHYKGTWDGVLIYEYDRMPLVSSTIQVCHNLIMGAEAGVLNWGQRTKFGEEFEDLKHNVIYELHDIRSKQTVSGTSNDIKLVRNSVDHGLVNVFCAAVAD